MTNRKHLIIPLSLIVVCIYLLYSVYSEVNKQTILELHKEQMVHAKQSASGLKIFFDNYETILGYLATTSPIINMDKQGQDLLFHFYSSHSNEITAVTRIDSTGKVIYTIPYDEKLIGRDISYQIHVKQFLNERKPVLSNVFHSIQGSRAIAFYLPVYKKNVFAGGLAILIPFEELTGKYVEAVRVRQHGFAWVLSNSGAILYYPDPAFADKPASSILSDSPETVSIIRKISTDSSGNFTYVSRQPNNTLNEMYADFYSLKVADKFWSIIVSTPKEEVFDTMRGFIIKWLSVFSLLLGLSIYYMYYTGKARTIIKEEVKRRKAEEALISSEKKFRTLVDVIPEGILLMDSDGRILTCNPKANKLFGNSQEEGALVGLNIKEMIVPDERAKSDLVFNNTKKNGLTKNVEYTFIKADGSTFPAEVSFAVIPVIDGQKDNFTAAIRDITERKKNEKTIIEAKEKAEKSDKLKSEFLAQMSHEIRSPINSILSFTSLIKDELVDKVSEDLKISFSIIENAGKRIIRTIGLILNMSEIQTGSFEISLKKINLIKDILDKIYIEYRQTAKDKNLDLAVQNDACGNLFIFADDYTIGQIFNNLVDNAIKYTNQGSITIAVFRKDPEQIVVEVKDTGIGISEEYIPNLFSPFSQEEQGYTRKYEGNGLGLALVKKYCDINNIKIEVESRKGNGSVFRIILKEYLM